MRVGKEDVELPGQFVGYAKLHPILFHAVGQKDTGKEIQHPSNSTVHHLQSSLVHLVSLSFLSLISSSSLLPSLLVSFRVTETNLR